MAEAVSNMVDDWEECSDGGAIATKSMLMVSKRKGIMEEREKEALEYLNRRTEQRDWTIGNAFVRRLARLQNRDDERCLPDRRNISRSHREVKDGREIIDGPGA